MPYVSDNFVWLLPASLGLSCLAFFVWQHRQPNSKLELVLYDTPGSCKNLIDGRLDRSSSKTLVGLLHARALPNARLCDAFGIDNAFTTTDVTRYKTFLKDAKNLVQTDSWDEIRDFTIELITSGQTAYEADLEGISLVPFIGTLVLTVILHFFFDASIEDLNHAAVQIAADEINDLWVLSKVKPLQKARLENDLTILRTHLEELLSHANPSSGSADRNPLNIILPTYETLWRVVLRCFMELRFRDTEVRHRAKTVFDKFLATPTPAQLDAGMEDTATDTTSVRWLVQEALRLYPPTRRIYRHVPAPVSDRTEPYIGGADIAYLHRDKEFWGKDAMKFNEHRWKGVKGEGDYFMPFGYGRFACPAKPTFGPMMIAVLVASLLDRFGEGWVLNEDVKGEEPLDLDRKALKELKVKKE